MDALPSQQSIVAKLRIKLQLSHQKWFQVMRSSKSLQKSSRDLNETKKTHKRLDYDEIMLLILRIFK